MKETHTGFMGTYFNKDTVLRISRASRILAWVVLGVYGVNFIQNIVMNVVQVRQGFLENRPMTDLLLIFLPVFRDLLVGGIFFLVMLGMANILLIFLDVEDNTRRAARQRES